MLKHNQRLFYQFLFLFFPFVGFSQTFNEIPGITGEIFFVEYTEEHNVMFIGGEELHISNDDGLSWYEVDNSTGSGLTDIEFYGAAAMSPTDYVVLGYDGGYDKIFVSNDAGQTWLETYSSLYTDFETENDIIDAHNGTVIISGEYGVYRSTDFGQTWNNVVIGNYTDPSDFLIYNNQSQIWYVGGDSDGIAVSSDDGDTWSFLGLGLDGADLRGSFASGMNTIISKETSSEFEFLTINEFGSIIDTFLINKSEIYFGNKDLARFGLTPGGDLLTQNDPVMYKLDTTNNDLYFFSYPGIQVSYSNGGLDLGTDIGIAFHSTYHSEEAYLIDYMTSGDFFVSANFEFVNGSSVCAGDNIIAEIYANQADSVRWYVDNQYYTSSSILSYPTTPSQYVTYSIKAEVFYNGEMSSITNNITLDPPAIPSSYTYTVDTTPCYGNPLPIIVNPSGGNQSQTLIQIDYNGQTVFGPMQMQSNSFNIWIPNIVAEDTFQIITTTNDPCSNNADTIVQGMTVGPNLLAFDYLAEDSVMCVNDSVEYKLFDTDPNWNYHLSSEYSFPYYNNQATTYSGVLNDSLTYYSKSVYIQTENVMQSALDPIYYYLNIEVDAPNGCSQSITLDTVRVYRPSAYFRIHQKTYELDSVLEVSNYIPVNNRLWSSSSMISGDISNLNDTVPTVSSSIPGIHSLTLRNEPIAGCIDERTEYVQYAERSPSHDNCSHQNAPMDKRVMKTKFDREGNLYSVGCYRDGPSYMRAATYSLERFDGTDSVLWSINGDFTGIHTYGAIIESIDFDKHNNVICVGWLSYDDQDYDDGIMVSDNPSGHGIKIFVFKLDGDDGSLIWKKDLMTMPIGYNGSTRLRPTDIVVSKENIYVSMYKSASLQFVVLDSSGNFIQHDELVMPFSQSQYFIGGVEHIPNSSFSWIRARYNSPTLKVLSNGDVLAMGRFKSLGIPGFPEFYLGNGSEFGLFALKYNMIDGIHGYETISKTGFHYIYNFYTSQSGIGEGVYFDVDQNDNIYVGSHIKGTYFLDDEILTVRDSVLPKTPHSYVFKMNNDYDLEWLTLGTHSEIQGLTYNRKSHEILLSGAINESIGFSSDTVDIFNGKELVVIHDSSTVSTVYENYERNRDAFLSSFDTLGNPSFVEVYDLVEYTAPYYNAIAETNLASSPCGDYALHISTLASNWLIDQDTVAIDSIKIVLGSSSQNCNLECIYLVPKDTVEVCMGSDIVPMFPKDYYSIDSVSYSVVADGNIVSSGNYSHMTNGMLSFELPSQSVNNTSLYIIYDNSISTDSTYILFKSSPSILYEDTICENDSLIVDFNSTDFDYVFNDTLNLTGNQYLIPQDIQNSGVNSFLLTSIHVSGYECFDTINYIVDSLPSGVTYHYDSVICNGDEVTFEAISPNNYSYYWWVTNETGSNITIDSLDYEIGINETYVDVTGLNGCQISDTLNFTVENCAGIDENQTSSFVLSPNPNNGKFEVKIKNGINVSKITIVSATGEIIETRNAGDSSENKEIIFDLSLAPGTYYVHVEVNGSFKIRKIVIK